MLCIFYAATFRCLALATRAYALHGCKMAAKTRVLYKERVLLGRRGETLSVPPVQEDRVLLWELSGRESTYTFTAGAGAGAHSQTNA